ncbi:hypothetical protein [Frankia sp. Cr2]|uniref:hypothetical protein n=1 Tax=Frankia sp. Cr2 TaxID=3073932 RepID=UPI002AD225EE|nr:hypothetical protein [Frankia sp. Cr2]
MRVFVHVLGASDLGVDSQARFHSGNAGTAAGATQPERVARLCAAIGARDVDTVRTLLTTPVADSQRRWEKVPLEILLESAVSGDRLLLVATDTGNPTGRDTAGLAEAIERALVIVPDLYLPARSPDVGPDVGPEVGPQIDPQIEVERKIDVERIVADGPTLLVGRRVLRDWLAAHREVDGIVTGIGTGPTGLTIGCLMAALADGRPVDVRPIQEPAHGRLVDLHVEDDPAPWLARRRMFGALAAHVGDGSPRTRDLLRMLDARQRLDVENFAKLASRYGIDPRSALAVTEPVALENAYFDRLVRREVQAVMLGRAWLLSEYSARRCPDDPIINDRNRRNPDETETLGPFIERVVERRPHGKAAAFLFRRRWINQFATDKSHGLRIPNRRYLVNAAGSAGHVDGRDPRRTEAALFAGMPGLPSVPDLFRWSSAASGEVLVVYCVGWQEERDGRRPFADAVCDAGTLRSLTDLIDPRPANAAEQPPDDHQFRAWLRFRLVASGQTLDLARGSAAHIAARLAAANPPDGPDDPDGPAGPADPGAQADPDALNAQADPGALEPIVVPMDIAGVRASVASSLLTVPGVADVEAVVVLAGPGANPMNAGLLLAGTDVATAVGCPVYVGAMVEAGGGGTRIEIDGGQVAALPGYPDVLARVALEHLTNLELTAAADTLRRGGQRLEPLAARAEEIRDAFIGGFSGTVAEKRAEVARRIELIKVLTRERAGGGRRNGGNKRAVQLAAGRTAVDDWHALHLAMTVADRVCGKAWRTSDLRISRLAYAIRSDWVTAHGPKAQTFAAALDKRQQDHQHRMPGIRIQTCADLLSHVQLELDPVSAPDRRSLRDAYEELTDRVRRWAEPVSVPDPVPDPDPDPDPVPVPVPDSASASEVGKADQDEPLS